MNKEKKLQDKELKNVSGGTWFSHDTYRDLRITFLPPVVSDKEHPLIVGVGIAASRCPYFAKIDEPRGFKKGCEICKNNASRFGDP